MATATMAVRMEDRPWTKSEFFAWSDGRRIVDLYELSKQLQCKQCCSLLDLRRTEREARFGLASVLYIVCNCGVMNDVHTGKTQHSDSHQGPMYEINIKASINLLMSGGGAGASRILNFLALLDIPVPPPDDPSLLLPVIDEPNLSNDPRSDFLPPISAPPATATITTSTPLTSGSKSASTPLTKKSPPALSVPPPTFASGDIYEEEDDNSVEETLESDRDDDDYVPHTKKAKTRTKPTPPKPKRKIPLRGPKSVKEKVKSAEKAKKKPGPKPKPKAKAKKTEVLQQEEEADDDEDATAMFLDPENMSSTDSEDQSETRKIKKTESEESWHEDDDDGDDDDAPVLKRKRGRPRGSKNSKTSEGKKTKSPKEGRVMPRCAQCDKEFSSIKGYNVHMKKVHNEDTKGERETGSRTLQPLNVDFYICNFCSQPYARDYGVINHIEFKHWTPEIRPKENYTKLSLRNILLEKPDESGYSKIKYKCSICSTAMPRSVAPGHICVDKNSRLACIKVCPNGKTLINNDQRLLLYSDKRNLLCPTCGALFSERINLDIHMNKEHGIVTERHRKHHCATCNKMFARKSGLDTHNIRVHRDGVFGKFICDYCGQEFKSRNSLYCHRKFAHVVGRGYKCEYCPKEFFKRHLWITHTKRHLGEKPFLCTICNKDFTSNYGLSVHSRIHLGQKPFRCPAEGCDRSFIQRSGFTEHMQRRHPELPIPSIRVPKEFSAKTFKPPTGNTDTPCFKMPAEVSAKNDSARGGAAENQGNVWMSANTETTQHQDGATGFVASQNFSYSGNAGNVVVVCNSGIPNPGMDSFLINPPHSSSEMNPNDPLTFRNHMDPSLMDPGANQGTSYGAVGAIVPGSERIIENGQQ